MVNILFIDNTKAYHIYRYTEKEQIPKCSVLLVPGFEKTASVAADSTSFAIDGLKSDSTYNVLISALSDSREGNPSILSVKTGATHNLSC